MDKYEIREIIKITAYYKDENEQEIEHVMFDKERDGPFDQRGFSVTFDEKDNCILDKKKEKEEDGRNL